MQISDTLPMQISSKDIRLKYDNGMNLLESNDPTLNYGRLDYESAKGMKTIFTQNVKPDESKLPEISV